MNAHTLCFSPTQTGAAIIEAVRGGMRFSPGKRFDITTADAQPVSFSEQDLLIVSMPVYSGRLPALAVKRFKQFKGAGTPVVATVIFGNRAYDDALLELTDLCTEQGFQVVAGAAFIGEHSFSNEKFPIAAHRPDASDIVRAAELGSLVQQRLDSGDALSRPAVPGNRPYKAEMNPVGAAAASNMNNCVRCGLCETFCPSGAITMTDEGPQTNADACIWCAACVKACTSHARDISLPKIHEITERLYNNCQTRLEPEWFIA